MISSRRLVFADLQQKHREPQKNENAFYKVSLISFRSSLLVLFCKFKSPNWPFKFTKQSKPIGSEKKQVHIVKNVAIPLYFSKCFSKTCKYWSPCYIFKLYSRLKAHVNDHSIKNFFFNTFLSL